MVRPLGLNSLVEVVLSKFFDFSTQAQMLLRFKGVKSAVYDHEKNNSTSIQKVVLKNERHHCSGSDRIF